MSLQGIASSLLNLYGEPVTLKYETGGDIDPATGVVTTPPTEVNVNGQGYLSRYDQGEIDGTLIKTTDLKLTLNAITPAPEQGWRCVADGTEFRLMDVMPVKNAGIVATYICQLRV